MELLYVKQCSEIAKNANIEKTTYNRMNINRICKKGNVFQTAKNILLPLQFISQKKGRTKIYKQFCARNKALRRRNETSQKPCILRIHYVDNVLVKLSQST
jgi:hypothetical protein